MPGVVRTRVGYAGGTKPNPTYRSLGDHTETLQVDFDPARVSYERLLEVFWESHDPFARPYSRQYKAVVFTHDEAQRRAAVESRNRFSAGAGGAVMTEVLPFTGFTRAEDYHQKYYLSHFQSLADEARAPYSDLAGFVDSTAAARLNGYVGHNADAAQLQAEIDTLGLSPKGRAQLISIVSKQ